MKQLLLALIIGAAMFAPASAQQIPPPTQPPSAADLQRATAFRNFVESIYGPVCDKHKGLRGIIPPKDGSAFPMIIVCNEIKNGQPVSFIATGIRVLTVK